jgi:hypothetical protein
MPINESGILEKILLTSILRSAAGNVISFGSKCGQTIPKSGEFIGSPDTVRPTYMSPAASYLRYRSCTPPNAQPARKLTATEDGHIVDPEEQNVAAPIYIIYIIYIYIIIYNIAYIDDIV